MKEMKHIRLVLLAVLLGCITLGIRLASGREDAPPARQPADILSFHGAPWLERLERVEMEKPEAVLDALNIRPGDVVADVGAGSGFFTVRLARRVGKEGKVYAVDIQQEMLDLIREKIGRMKLTNVEPVLGETADPKLPPAIVDLVFIVDAYHEFQKPIALMRRLREALRAGHDHRVQGGLRIHPGAPQDGRIPDCGGAEACRPRPCPAVRHSGASTHAHIQEIELRR